MDQNVARTGHVYENFKKKSLGELFVDQMMGLGRQSMNPMTFGNMKHPNMCVQEYDQNTEDSLYFV